MFINFPPLEDVIIHGLDEIELPRMVTVNQQYDAQKTEDIEGDVRKAMDAAVQDKSVYAGKRICITAGSRGIPDLALMIKTMCAVLREWGAEPFVIPAMGSHGGGTAEGQLEILEGYGVTEKSIGAPILASMDVTEYGELSDGTKLYCDSYAWQADGIVLFNKVKPHSDFRGKNESGLAKMVAIGLGKHMGASTFHGIGFDKFAQYIPEAAEKFLAVRGLVLGVGVVQNAFDEICDIRAAEKDGILELDAELLKEAKLRMAKFKFTEADILVVDEIGKNISGWGHDSNVTGRTCAIAPEGFSDIFKSRFMVVLGLSEESHHNGCGLSSADMTTRRCLNSIDWGPTWTNIFNNREIQGGKIPMYADNDRDAVRLAVRCLATAKQAAPRIVHIKNTLSLSSIEVSESMYEQIKDMPGVEKAGPAHDWEFDGEGFLA